MGGRPEVGLMGDRSLAGLWQLGMGIGGSGLATRSSPAPRAAPGLSGQGLALGFEGRPGRLSASHGGTGAAVASAAQAPALREPLAAFQADGVEGLRHGVCSGVNGGRAAGPGQNVRMARESSAWRAERAGQLPGMYGATRPGILPGKGHLVIRIAGHCRS